MTTDHPRRQARHRLHPRLEYRMFVVRDPRADELQEAVPAADQLLMAGPGGVFVGSGGNDFDPDVFLEIWDGPPRRHPWRSAESRRSVGAGCFNEPDERGRG